LLTQPDVLYRFEKEGPGSETTKSYFDGTDKRWKIWGTAWRMFLDNPLTGVGHGQFESSYSHYSDDPSFPIQGHAHCDLLNIAASMGVFGLLAYLLLFILPGWNLYTHFRRERNESMRVAAVGGILVLVSFLVMGLFEAFFMDEESRLTLIFLLGLSFVQIRLLSQPAEDVV
jgi:(heptosyl)LPS beta-1,4-glucosyltransferase